MAFRLLKNEPALTPLFFAVGLGVVGSFTFAYHYLANNQDVVIRKSAYADRDPWNHIAQNKNTKLMSFNKDFWASRANMPDPRASFLSETEGKVSDKVEKAKALAIEKMGLKKGGGAGKEDAAAH